VQFAAVPICSSACELDESPPSPTQNAEKLEEPAEHVTFGSLHVAVTLVNVSGVVDEPVSIVCASAIA
jgi:hypothetical protein